jgi:hypothetical protein
MAADARRFTPIIALAVVALSARAQHLQLCATLDTPLPFTGPSWQEIERFLTQAGYTPTGDSLRSALADGRADVRAAAAQELMNIPHDTNADLAPLLTAYEAERDSCARGAMFGVLTSLLHGIARDPKQHPGGQPYVTPFQDCSLSGRTLISATLEQVVDPYVKRPVVQITLRNQTAKTIAFPTRATPMSLFSVSVISPAGERVAFKPGTEWMYEPIKPMSPDQMVLVEDAFRLFGFIPLSPYEDATWLWRIEGGFDLSAPGTYTVSFGGRLDYLDTTICTNTLLFKVGN